jgi:plastocyanin
MYPAVPRVLTIALAASAVVCMGTVGPSAEQDAGVRGRVEIGIPITTRRPTAAYPARSVPAPSLAPTSEIKNVVVYLKNAPPRPTTPVHATIVQRDETFLPRVIAVPVGSEVSFPNEDHIYHNVFSLSRAKAYNLGRYRQGTSQTVRFDKPGVVKVFCDIHSHMTATVLVFNHPWFATPDDDGRFQLAGVPPGDRQITAWHERLGDTTVHVRLEAGQATSADFTLPVPPE